MTGRAESWAFAALVGSAMLALVTAWLVVRLRVLTRQLAAVTGAPPLLEQVDRLNSAVDALGRRVDHVAQRMEHIGAQAQRSLQRVGLVRYDAFQDLGGQLSFSIALLDADRNGFVLSVLNGREGARAYAKPVRAGASSAMLSDEERRAIVQA
ncbi:MAG: DUF4446 family protein [Armatimonadota bacterium]|nr:DUF4446 family protein [Armatimonadota bacterium]